MVNNYGDRVRPEDLRLWLSINGGEPFSTYESWDDSSKYNQENLYNLSNLERGSVSVCLFLCFFTS